MYNVYKNNNLSIKIDLSHLVLQWIIFSLRLTQNLMQNAIKYSFTLKTNSHTLTIFKSHNIQRKCMSFDYMSLLGCWGKLKLSPVTMYNIKLLSLKKFRCSFSIFCLYTIAILNVCFFVTHSIFFLKTIDFCILLETSKQRIMDWLFQSASIASTLLIQIDVNWGKHAYGFLNKLSYGRMMITFTFKANIIAIYGRGYSMDTLYYCYTMG